jgi:thiol-disulfide isomerase/thioredoxin
MDPVTDTEDRDSGKQRSHRFSIRGVSLTVALALSIATALALSYDLVLLMTPTDDVAAPTATTKDLHFSFLDQPAELPEIHFVDGAGRSLTLGDFRGRPILLNLWATWCVPCRKEMPSLDHLQAKFDPSRFLVLTLSIDRRGVPAIEQFYQELGLKSLSIYLDQPGATLQLLQAPGLPTTLFIDRDGKVIGRKIGPAEWDNPETIALLRKHLDLPSNEPETEGSK